MTATIEELLRHLIAWEIIHRTETHQYAVVDIGILSERDGELVTSDGKRHVHQSFQIALDEIILLHLLAGYGIVTGMERLDDLQLLVHQMTAEADCRNTGVVEDAAINLILVDTLGKQLADDVVDVRIGRILGASTRISHHTAIYAGSPGLI